MASTSNYRRELLARLGLKFTLAAPAVDEHSALTPHKNPINRARTLACAKAISVASKYPNALIIGSDQVAEMNGIVLHKPGNRSQNIAQLSMASGQMIRFHTGLCVLDSSTGVAVNDVVLFTVWLRTLTEAQIAVYVDREPAFDCAGGFKAEGMGAALIERMYGADPTALIGLPLIRLVGMLGEHGLDVLGKIEGE